TGIDSCEVEFQTAPISAVPIGTIITSMLPFKEFCQEIGQESGPDNFDPMDQENCIWAPADGRSCRGSEYARLGNPQVPDLRGVFLRGLNLFDNFQPFSVPESQKDPSNERVAGSFQNQDIQPHFHDYMDLQATERAGIHSGDVRPDPGHNRDARRTTLQMPSAETRPKNISVYRYIKIN
ncbi:MAG: hypothetical protein AAFU03_05150, partial [Bacteroidota bacterium]